MICIHCCSDVTKKKPHAQTTLGITWIAHASVERGVDSIALGRSCVQVEVAGYLAGSHYCGHGMEKRRLHLYLRRLSVRAALIIESAAKNVHPVPIPALNSF